jgi:hypothetical protein
MAGPFSGAFSEAFGYGAGLDPVADFQGTSATTTKLMNRFPRWWRRDGKPTPAIGISTTGQVQWSILDGTLYLAYGPAGGPYTTVQLQLATYTIIGIAAALAAIPGCSVTYLADRSITALGAQALMASSGDTANGSNILAASMSLSWRFMDAAASELERARAHIRGMPLQMSLPTATGWWLDHLAGGWFGLARLSGESDATYAQRAPVEIFTPKSNNVGMEIALEAAFNQAATVSDAVAYSSPEPKYDGVLRFDGSWQYQVGSMANYCLFDVTIGYSYNVNGDRDAYIAQVTALINRCRAAGCFLRTLTIV